MQDILFYATANETLATVRDYANAKTVAAPTLTRSVSVRLLLRLFADTNDLDPVPVESFSAITAWAFVMDDDFDDTSTLKIVADNEAIDVTSETETTTDPDTGGTITRTYTQFSIPISEMNSEALTVWLGTSESKGGLIGELTGYNADGDSVFVLQIKGFTIRNRLYGGGEPSENVTEYLTIDEARAMFADAATADENAFKSAVIVSGDNNDLNGIYRYFEKTKLPWIPNQLLSSDDLIDQVIVKDVFINESAMAFIRFKDCQWQLVKGSTLGYEMFNIKIYYYPWIESNSNKNCPPSDTWYKALDHSKSFVYFRFVPRTNVLKKSY